MENGEGSNIIEIDFGAPKKKKPVLGKNRKKTKGKKRERPWLKDKNKMKKKMGGGDDFVVAAPKPPGGGMEVEIKMPDPPKKSEALEIDIKMPEKPKEPAIELKAPKNVDAEVISEKPKEEKTEAEKVPEPEPEKKEEKKVEETKPVKAEEVEKKDVIPPQEEVKNDEQKKEAPKENNEPQVPEKPSAYNLDNLAMIEKQLMEKQKKERDAKLGITNPEKAPEKKEEKTPAENP